MSGNGTFHHLRRASVISLMILFALFMTNADGLAQSGPQEPTISYDVITSTSGVAAGGTIQVAYILDIPPDHHVTDKSYGLYYFDPTLPDGFALTDTRWPKAVIEHDEEVYRGSVVMMLTLAVDESVAPGDYDLAFWYGYQICYETPPPGGCFLPNGGEGNLTLTVLEAGTTPIPSSNPVFADLESSNPQSAAASTSEGDSSSLENKLTNALESGSFLAFIFVFAAGFLISLTPCVYPMIPIIIGFVGSSAGGNKMKGFILSLFFVLGLAIVYASLGVVAGLTGALFGAFMQNPIVLWFIVAVFVALGASMLGAFDISVPAAMQDKMMSGERSGIFGAMFIGGVTGIVAAPCAGPPLLVLLSWIGNTGNVILGFLYMGTLALGIGVLFVVIGTSAAAMTALPQAGAWMDKIKKGLGILIFGVAIYYLNLLLSPDVFQLLLGASLVLFGLYIGAASKWDELVGLGKLGKGIGFTAIIAGSFYIVLGLAGMNDVNLSGGNAAGPGGAVEQADEGHVPWNVNMYDEAFQMAAAEGKPVLIDFYADWCGVCVELDHNVWNQQIVIDAAQNYIPLKLDYTKTNDELESLRKKHGIGGLPTVMIVGPDGTERARFNSFMEPEDVVDWLNSHK
jgi:thioredoxin:protein disulfide reductase